MAPGSARTWLGLASVELTEGNLAEAGQLADRGLSLAPANAELLRLKAMLACRALDRRAAWDLFDRADALMTPDAGHSTAPWRLLQRASCALTTHEFPRAIEYARSAQDRGAWIADARAVEGLALQQLGDLRGAQRALKEAVRIDPHRRDLKLDLERLWEEAGGPLPDTPR